MRDVQPGTPLAEALGPKSVFVRKLARLGLRTVRDLLWHFPSRYEDFTRVYKIEELQPGQQATIHGEIEEVRASRSWHRHMNIVEAMIADETGSIRAVWFNQPYIANVLKEGRRANFSGKVSLSNEGEIYLTHPTYEIIRGESGGAAKHTARLVPIYPETRGLTSRGIRFMTDALLKKNIAVKEWIPEEILEENDFPEIKSALEDIHFPNTIEEAEAARRRFAFEDLFLLQLTNLERKNSAAREKAPEIKMDIEHVKGIIASLPFELTLSQKKSLWEILKDMEQPHPMNRLLQGDVGSGKTAVAAIAAAEAAAAGWQTAFMAPTEVLARQHFETLIKLFHGAGGKKSDNNELHDAPVIALLTANDAMISYGNGLSTELKKTELVKKIMSGKNGGAESKEDSCGNQIDIVVGTHALISGSRTFNKLALAIVDEQHRFGVRQRAALTGNSHLVPHFLSMSATPIPRTLTLTVFGDLDISAITELPAGRKKIETKIIPPEGRADAYKFVKGEISKGRQAFVICPRIEPDDKTSEINNKTDHGTLKTTVRGREFATLEIKSVKEEFDKLSKKIFPDLKVGMLHGAMKPKEKAAEMEKFKNGATDILVATSVIEVGVDVPNATIMMIEGSERFGLAQLYQFRGRVGRGEHASYCFLFTESQSDAAKSRLSAIVNAKNGFELAEMDLKLRGPGEFFGESQSGMPDVAMNALREPLLVKSSRDSAHAIISKDPMLKNYPLLRAELTEFRKRIHME